MNWKHNQLAHDLAEHLRGTGRVVWEDMQLGPAGSPRPDCFSIAKSFVKFQPLAYEVKISKSDFRRDVTAGKWHAYLEYAAGIYFAVPSGLITKADLPDGCGLMVRSDSGWRAIRKPTLKPIDTLPRAAWLKLVIDGIARQRAETRIRVLSEYCVQQDIRNRYGEELAQALSDRDAAVTTLRDQVERARQAYEKAQNQADKIRRDAVESARRDAAAVNATVREAVKALGLPDGATVWDVTAKLTKALKRIDGNAEVARLRASLQNVQRSAAAALEQSID